MEFNEKLQKLRSSRGLTQEELAAQLFVSRAAVSKWESGRGYPGIDLLRAIAGYFHVSIDELIGGEEIVSLAEQDLRAAGKRYGALLCGVLDCLTVLLFFIPVFGCRSADMILSVPLFSLTGTSPWLKTAFAVLIGLTVLNGFCTVLLGNFSRPRRMRGCVIAGAVLTVTGTALFMLARQPYAGVFLLCILVLKGLALLKSK